MATFGLGVGSPQRCYGGCTGGSSVLMRSASRFEFDEKQGSPQLPIFKGLKNQFWSLKMKTLFRSQELWSLVDEGSEDARGDEPNQALREKRRKDGKALFMSQQALDHGLKKMRSASRFEEDEKCIKKHQR